MLEFVDSKGVFLYDQNQKPYLDLISGISVSNIGHGHPKVVAAVQQQAEKFMHLMVYGEYVLSPQVKYAKLLCQQLPENLQSVYLVNSGTEATEGALKLAKRYTGKTEIIYFENAYHGSTHGALSVMGNEYYRQAYRPLLPDTRMIKYGCFEDLAYISEKTAAVIIEPVQAESGVQLPPENYLQQLKNKCLEKNCLLIFDEIQTGFGRTGKLFAFQHENFSPDILLLAKAMGGGMPLGAFVASAEIMKTLSYRPVLGHITTFGGHPVSCAAAQASLSVLLEEPFIDQVEAKAQIFKNLLKHPLIKKFRNKGLLIALEFENEKINQSIIQEVLKNGVITDWFLYAPHCLRIAPPLIIREEEIEFSCQQILKAISTIH